MASHSHSHATSSVVSLLVALGLHAGVFLLSPHSIEASASRPTVVELEFASLAATPRVTVEQPPVAPVRHVRRAVEHKVHGLLSVAKTVESASRSEPLPAVAAVVEEPSALPPALPAATAPTSPSVETTSAGLPVSQAAGADGVAGFGSGVKSSGVSGSSRGPSASGSAPGTSSGGVRAVQLASKRWECPWPAEAEYEDIHEQLVPIRVLVSESGMVENVEVLSDPGHGFGAAARRCARAARFASAKDAQGRALRAHSPPIHVRFVR